MNLLRKLETFLGCIGISSSLVLASLPPAKAQGVPETPTCADPANETP